jgi:hypothetical protein
LSFIRHKKIKQSNNPEEEKSDSPRVLNLGWGILSSSAVHTKAIGQTEK